MGGIWEKNWTKKHEVVVSEWLRRQTRNLLGLPAQVRILPTTFFLLTSLINSFIHLNIYLFYFLLFIHSFLSLQTLFSILPDFLMIK